ncbi:MAG TPA: segregation/condensation protein A [Acidobacteriota bacterium]|nr:segregation/condensation protein A [Acidobacteriota bacterium]HNT16565.1 segregation/condensation protein A [Acidobacteriota bacterium]HPA26810.1 segregation/condensation protein A [Acidobacteriota bacterium]HQO19048.1 segregation/condensation protein A [Acidobacteriota bacterium]HQQ45941.1 segregation/condensation protein A [Acidobacteriota bacterium]
MDAITEPGKFVEAGDGTEPRYSLPVFKGPLDLLLYFIDKNELDIYDIPIAQITEQYNRYLSKMKDLNLYIAADFITMAATLISIKGQMLLPRHTREEAVAEDPRKTLVDQLLEHRKLIEAGHILGEKEALAISQFHRREIAGEGSLDTYDLEVWDLVGAIKNVIQRIENKETKIILVEEKNIAEKMEEVLALIRERGTALFTELLGEDKGRFGTVLTFVTVLEMAKKRVVSLFQDAPFGPIRVLLRKKQHQAVEPRQD